MIVLQAGSYACIWAVQRSRCGPSVGPVVTSQLASNAFGRMVPGGAAAGAMQYGMLGGRRVPASAASGMTASSLLVFATLPRCSAGVRGSCSPWWYPNAQPAAFGGVVFLALSASARRADWTVRRSVLGVGRRGGWNGVLRREPHLHRPAGALPRGAQLMIAHSKPRWWQAVPAAARWVLDYLTLLTALPPWSSAALAGPAGLLRGPAAGAVPLTPGGLGFVEAGLTGRSPCWASPRRGGGGDPRLPPRVVLAPDPRRRHRRPGPPAPLREWARKWRHARGRLRGATWWRPRCCRSRKLRHGRPDQRGLAFSASWTAPAASSATFERRSLIEKVSSATRSFDRRANHLGACGVLISSAPRPSRVRPPGRAMVRLSSSAWCAWPFDRHRLGPGGALLEEAVASSARRGEDEEEEVTMPKPGHGLQSKRSARTRPRRGRAWSRRRRGTHRLPRPRSAPWRQLGRPCPHLGLGQLDLLADECHRLRSLRRRSSLTDLSAPSRDPGRCRSSGQPTQEQLHGKPAGERGAHEGLRALGERAALGLHAERGLAERPLRPWRPG